MNDSAYAFLVQSDDFGPIRPGAFDFTLLFEDSFLAIAPASIFLLAACARTAYLYNSPAKVESDYSKQIKVVRMLLRSVRFLLILQGFPRSVCRPRTCSAPAVGRHTWHKQ